LTGSTSGEQGTGFLKCGLQVLGLAPTVSLQGGAVPMLAADKPVGSKAFAVLWEFGHYFRGRTTCGPFLGVNCCKAQMPDLVHPCDTSGRGGRDESVVFLRHLASWMPSLLHVCDQARASSEP